MTDAGALLKELNALWRQIGAQQGGGVLRACSMTLVAIAREEDDPQELGETLSRLTIEHPNRTVLLRLKRDPAAKLSTRTAVDCWRPFGRQQQICAERIEIESGANGLDGVPPLVLGLAVPDLPVVCWIRAGALSAGAALSSVVSLAGRVIADTTPEEHVASALALLRRIETARTTIADLAWTRITRWRKAIATALESGPCRRLSEIDEIEIGWAGEGTPTVAVYLAAWLRGVFPEAALRLAMCDRARPAKGRIRRVRLAGRGGQILLERPEGTGVTITMNGLQMGAVFPALDEVDLLREELSIFGRDEIFDAALSRSDEILRMLED